MDQATLANIVYREYFKLLSIMYSETLGLFKNKLNKKTNKSKPDRFNRSVMSHFDTLALAACADKQD